MSPHALIYFILLALFAPAAGQVDPRAIPQANPDKTDDIRLPNGKLQSQEILRADHEKSVQDAKEMVALAESLEKDLDQVNAKDLLSMADIHKTEEIEKLAKRIRARIRHL